MMRIRELRKERHISQKDLAEQFHVAQTTVSGWEKGVRDPDTSTVALLAAFFDVSTDYLLGKSDIKKAPSAEALSTTPEAEALREVMKSLSPEDRQRVLDFGRGLAATAHKPKQPK